MKTNLLPRGSFGPHSPSNTPSKIMCTAWYTRARASSHGQHALHAINVVPQVLEDVADPVVHR